MAKQQEPMVSTDDPGAWLGAVSDMWLTMVGAQWQAVAQWQQALASMQQEWWDEWAAHWAGGAPIGD